MFSIETLFHSLAIGNNSKLYFNEKAEAFFSHTERTFFIRHSSEYEMSDNDRKVNRNIYQMRIDPHEKKNTTSDWPQGLANGHLFTHCSVEE